MYDYESDVVEQIKTQFKQLFTLTNQTIRDQSWEINKHYPKTYGTIIESPLLEYNGVIEKAMFIVSLREMTESLISQMLGQSGIAKFYKQCEKNINSNNIQTIEDINKFQKEINVFFYTTLPNKKNCSWGQADRVRPYLPEFHIQNVTPNEFLGSRQSWKD